VSRILHLLHLVGHAIWLGAQYANIASGGVPVRYQPIVAAVIGLVQAIHGYYVGRSRANYAR